MKSGIEYFPLDCQLDEKFELIEAEFGLTGFAVVVKLLQRIYAGQGYYCEWTNEVALLFSKKIGLGCNAVSEIVGTSIKRGIFDKTLYEDFGILTSRGIQSRYLEAVSRRKKVEVKKEYLLINCDQISKNVDISSENVCRNQNNADISKQSKVKEIRVKESKVEYKQIVDLFNNTCVSFPRVITLSDKRKRTIKKLCQTYSLSQVKEVFEKAEQSKFLKGDNNRDWSANFDWLMDEKNFIKVLEGNYADRRKNAENKRADTDTPERYGNYI